MVLPKPIPGSMAMPAARDAEAFQRRDPVAQEARDLQHHVGVAGLGLHGARARCPACASARPARRPRSTTCSAAPSWRSAVTSLTISRPGLQRRRHGGGVAGVDARPARRGRGRGPPAGCGGSPPPAVTGAAPGRVLSPPMSRMSAPASSIAWPRAMAAAVSAARPSPEKLSGVTLTMPMTSGRPGSAARCPAKGGGRRVSAGSRSCQSSGIACTGRMPRSAPASISRTRAKAAVAALQRQGEPVAGRKKSRRAFEKTQRLDPAVRSRQALGGGRRPRVQPARGRTRRAAAGRHAAAALRHRLVRPVPHDRLAADDQLDLVARQRLVLQQALGQQVQLVDVLADSSCFARA